jgi:hypothetical protein
MLWKCGTMRFFRRRHLNFQHYPKLTARYRLTGNCGVMPLTGDRARIFRAVFATRSTERFSIPEAPENTSCIRSDHGLRTLVLDRTGRKCAARTRSFRRRPPGLNPGVHRLPAKECHRHFKPFRNNYLTSFARSSCYFNM